MEAYDVAHGNSSTGNVNQVSEALGPLFHTVCKGGAGVRLKAVWKTDGVQRLAGVGVLVPGQIHD